MATTDRSGTALLAWFEGVASRARAAYPVEREELSYGPAREQVLDLWGDPGADVVVVAVHGGYFAAEFDRSINEPLSRHLAAAGLAVANVEYRRTGSSADPLDSVRDVRAAVRAVARRCGRDRLVLLGHSAGGYLALTASTEPAALGVLALAPVTRLRRIADGGHDGGGLRRWLGTGPSSAGALDRMVPERVGLGAVPVHVLHGALDAVVPVGHSVEWCARQREVGSAVTLDVLPDAGHYEFLDPDSAAVGAVRAALRRLVGGVDPSGAAAAAG